MTLEQALDKSLKVRRKSWPSDNYILFNKGLEQNNIELWDNEDFKWIKNFVLPLNDIISEDWESVILD